MNIMFMKRFPDGTETRFVSKIIKGVLGTASEMNPNDYPKIHTIRQSKRVRKGMRLSLRYWQDKPYRSKQCKFMEAECKSVQDVEIRWDKDIVSVKVGDAYLNETGIDILAKNDGFESADDFLKWFKDDFDGQIIHWTELNY